MIYKFIGGPLDGKETEIPSEELERSRYVLMPIFSPTESTVMGAWYEPGDIGDLIFIPTK